MALSNVKLRNSYASTNFKKIKLLSTAHLFEQLLHENVDKWTMEIDSGVKAGQFSKWKEYNFLTPFLLNTAQLNRLINLN